ncbi:hypothetical protein MPNT_270011 [Candidatus Methylacidithermus pantelleriae]|uniref:Uncharacterized protein n=1 Tax=Candidatus Methylacidithermus pantelleriae TaxID=2744239 RepID=A0A8J2BT56_9BACT|nr:hypothetical protein MPNT_270011 [Candidatus Methylacidithermus pantelleriae]
MVAIFLAAERRPVLRIRAVSRK